MQYNRYNETAKLEKQICDICHLILHSASDVRPVVRKTFEHALVEMEAFQANLLLCYFLLRHISVVTRNKRKLTMRSDANPQRFLLTIN